MEIGGEVGGGGGGVVGFAEEVGEGFVVVGVVGRVVGGGGGDEAVGGVFDDLVEGRRGVRGGGSGLGQVGGSDLEGVDDEGGAAGVEGA